MTGMSVSSPGRAGGVRVIEVGGGCNNACSFCAARMVELVSDFDALRARILEGAAAGDTEIVFSGHEPSIHPRFIELLGAAKAAGYSRIRVETNGRMFAYERLAGAAIDAGATEFAVNLFAADEKTALRINPVDGAFAQTMAGLKNLVGAAGTRAAVSAIITLCPDNATESGAMVSLASASGVRAVEIVPLEELFGAGGGNALAGAVADAESAAARAGMSLDVRGGGRSLGVKDSRMDKQDDDFLVTTWYTVGRGRRREIFSEDIRVNYRCNQNCAFCGVDHKKQSHPPERILEAVRGAAARGTRRLFLSGGEPTLDPRLPEYVAIAKEGGIHDVTLMTNAVLLSGAAPCRTLRDAGLDKAFVSLHSHDAALSDKLTRAPGTFDKTVAGAKNLIDAGITTGLIIVMNGLNVGGLADYVRFAAREFPGAGVFLSYASPYFTPTLPQWAPPRYSALIPALREAFDAAKEAGAPITCMEEQHSIPRCILPERDRVFRNLFGPLQMAGRDGFVKTAGCADCTYDAGCPGMKGFYAAMFGTDEISPVN